MCKVYGIDPTINCRKELRFPTGRDSEIAPTGFLCIFAKNFTRPILLIPLLFLLKRGIIFAIVCRWIRAIFYLSRCRKTNKLLLEILEYFYKKGAQQ